MINAMMSALMVSTLSSLYEEPGRVKVAKGIVLTGITLIMLGILHPAFDEPYTYILVFVISVLLAVGGIQSLNRFEELINNILLDSYLCLYAGEGCEKIMKDIMKDRKKPIESLMNRVSDLLIGKWSSLEDLLDEIGRSKDLKALVRLLFCILMYQASSLSLGLLFALVLEALGAADAIMRTAKIPITWTGATFIALGIVLSASAPVLDEDKSKSGEGSQQALQLLPSDAYKKMLLVSPRNRLEKVLIRLAMTLSAASPNYVKPKLDLPLVTPINLYECSPRLGDIIDELKKLEKYGYLVEVHGDPSSIYTKGPGDGGCENNKGVSKFIGLHHEKSPLEVFNEIMLINKENITHGAKILIWELKSAGTETDKHEDKEKNLVREGGEKSGRLVAVMAIKAWKGCVKYTRIRRGSSSTDRGRDGDRKMRVETWTESRRVLSIFVVGRRGLASLINVKVLAYLRPASIENVLCEDDETGPVTST